MEASLEKKRSSDDDSVSSSISFEEMSSETSKNRREQQVLTGDGDHAGGSMTPVKALAVVAIKQKRDQEKQVLNQLNDRFAKYIDRVKFLEAQNKKLQGELEELRQRWGQESRSIRERYEPELLEARASIDDTTREKAISEIRAKRSEYEIASLKRQHEEALGLAQADKSKIASLEYVLQENQVELELLKKQMQDAETDIDKYKREVVRLGEDLDRLLTDLDQETLKRAKLENEKQTLEEQIPFLNAIHEQEMAELRSLQAGGHVDPAQFYRHELERAIRDIRSDFEDLSQQQKRDLEEWYKIKAEEIVHKYQKVDAFDSVPVESLDNLKYAYNENQKEFNELKQHNLNLIMRLGQLEEDLDQKRRKNAYELDQQDREIVNLRQKLHDTTLDYDDLLSSKASLEFEINTYRRLLESEESRKDSPDAYLAKYANNVNHHRRTHAHKDAAGQREKYNIINLQPIKPSTPTNKNGNFMELGAKTTFHRNAKGPLSISECSPDGRVIVLENTSRSKDVNLTNWLLVRRVDSNDEIRFLFPANLVVKANKTVKIWARGFGKENLPYELVNTAADSWGTGSNVVTVIYNEFKEEKARYMLTTIHGEA